MTSKAWLILILLICTPAWSGDRDLAFPCLSCHGENGEGSESRLAPALAGQQVDYLARQLRNYRDGLRGAHSEDVYGQKMALVIVNITDDQQLENIAKYYAQLPDWQPVSRPMQVPGNGAALYASCATCHGVNGEGNAALKAPKIGGLYANYITAQLRHFRSGVRGYSEMDSSGLQMRAMMAGIQNDSDILAVAAYINQLSGHEPNR